jgi:hypothetical protein
MAPQQAATDAARNGAKRATADCVTDQGAADAARNRPDRAIATAAAPAIIVPTPIIAMAATIIAVIVPMITLRECGGRHDGWCCRHGNQGRQRELGLHLNLLVLRS